MKTFLLSSLLLFACFRLTAQSVYEIINFDNYINSSNNDLENYFNETFQMSLRAIPDSGITGGCVATSDTNNFGNDNAIYCSKFSGMRDSVYETGISFKYDSALVDDTRFERPVALWFTPSADFNHYLIATISPTKLFALYTYSWTNPTSPSLPLLHNYWYRFSVTTVFTGGLGNDQIDLTCNLYDLGLTGTNTPSLAASYSATFYDNILFADSSISVGINGTRFGGAIYLDDFTFQGVKNSDTCIVTSIADYNLSELQLEFSVENSTLVIAAHDCTGPAELKIFNMNGKELYHHSLPTGSSQYDISHLPAGVYFINVLSKDGRFSDKFVLSD